MAIYIGGNDSSRFGGFMPMTLPDGENGVLHGSQKLSYDFYNVYVNGDLVGQRASIAQGDRDQEAVDDYLKSRNFNNYNIKYSENEIFVEADSPGEARQIKNNLSVFLQVR